MCDGTNYAHGCCGGVQSSQPDILEFETGEFVYRIEGRSDTKCIVELTFVTNKRM